MRCWFAYIIPSCPRVATRVEIPGVANSSECQSSSICVLANGTLLYNISAIQCNSILTCTNPSNNCTGTCSDQQFLAIHEQNFPATNATTKGACVTPRLYPIGNFGGISLLPLCDYTNSTNFPNGCLTIYNQSECSQISGAYWYYPATNPQQCLQPQGCYENYNDYTTLYLEAQFFFSGKNQYDCLSPNNPLQLSSWLPFFEWTPSQQRGGVLRSNLTWVPNRQVVSKSLWTNTTQALDYDGLAENWLQIYSTTLALIAKSEFLCSFESSQTITNTFVCDCASDVVGTDTSTCFSNHTAIPVSQLTICNGDSSQLVLTNSIFNFNNQSAQISQQCTTLLISSISVDAFQNNDNTSTATLSANFAKFDSKFYPYAVLNSNGATVGQLIGDGFPSNASGAQ